MDKRRSFSLIDFADSGPDQSEPLDEASLYNLMNQSQVKSDGEKFLK